MSVNPSRMKSIGGTIEMAPEFEVYAENEKYRIEWLRRLTMMVIDKETGNCKVIPYKTPVSDVRDAVKHYGVDKTISVYLILCKDVEWSPMYKPAARINAF